MSLFKVWCRTYQKVMKVASVFLPWRMPELITGAGSIVRLPETMKGMGLHKTLIVTDAFLHGNGFIDSLKGALAGQDIEYFVFDETVPNPTVENVEKARQMYLDNNCDSIIAFGGGSPMDCAKGVGARVARPKKPLSKMKGVLKVLKKLPPFFAVPTTAGSGSECTLAAIISDPATHDKYAIMDTPLIPRYAVLDPEFTVGLPKHITSTTGIDALTHAVESYIGKGNTKNTKKWAEEAVVLIANNLKKVYDTPTDLVAREAMQLAAYKAGAAFTRAYVGTVHAIAHALGGLYNTPHGLANAVLLPVVLKSYGSAADKPLAALARIAGVSEEIDDRAAAKAFVEWIEGLNTSLEIPTKILERDGSPTIKQEDIEKLAGKAYKEINPLYPVPKILSVDEIIDIIKVVA